MFSSYTDDEKWAMFDHMAVIVTNANSATYDAIESADLREFFRIFREVADAMRSGSLGEMALRRARRRWRRPARWSLAA